MPKSKSASKTNIRAHPLAKKARKPQVQVTYEDAESRPVKDIKGKGRAKQAPAAAPVAEQFADSEEDEDVKPVIDDSEDGDETKPNGTEGINASFIIIAGSYEKNLYGVEGTFITSVDAIDGEEPELVLAPSFIFPAHLSCIKSLAVSEGGKWLVTGSDDEFVKVWDLRRRKEIGSLSQHVGSITSLTFPSSSHLLSTSEDSTITVFRTRDWVPLRTLKGHSGKVNAVDVHPSGKIALSVGKDQTLRMWDLMRGRGASSLGLGFEAELVRFSKSGKVFAILGYNSIDIYTINMRKVATLRHPKNKRLHDVLFGNHANNDGEDVELLFTGTEDGKIYTWQLDEAAALSEEEGEQKQAVCRFRGVLGGHSNRVKSIDFMMAKRPTPYSTIPIVVSVSSDGKMNVHNVLSLFNGIEPSSEEGEALPLASYDTTGSRLVCCKVSEVTKPIRQIKQESVKTEIIKKEEEGIRFKPEDGGDDQSDGAETSEQDDEELEMEQEDEDELEQEEE